MGRFSKLERTGRQPGDTEAPVAPAPGMPTPGEKGSGPAQPVESFDYPTALQRAEEHFYRGEFEKALRFFSRALQTENSQPTPWIGQIKCLLMMKQLKEADLWLQRALDLFSEDASLLSLRAVVMAQRGMVKRAIGTSDYAMTRGGATPLPWIARGEVLTLAESKNAGFCYEKAMETAEPDDWKTPFHIGLIYYDQGIWASALEYFQKAAARGAGNYWLWFLLGTCYSRLAFRQEAIDAFRQSIALNNAYPPAQQGFRRATHQPLWSRILGGLRRRKA